MLLGEDSRDGLVGKEHPGQDRKDRTARTEKTSTGHSRQDFQGRTLGTENIRNRTFRVGLSGQDIGKVYSGQEMG